jgi:hypothetical protein
VREYPPKKPRKTDRRVGWRTFPVLGRVETETLVARLRRYRGRLTFGELLDALGVPRSRASWLSMRKLCRDHQIITKDPDDPDYFPRVVARDERALAEQDRQEALDRARDEQVAKIRAVLKREIAAAIAEKPTVKPFKQGDLSW